MKSLSQSQYGELRDLYLAIYEQVELTEELLDETFDEIVDELIEEGYGEEEALDLAEEATDAYLEEAKVTFGHDTAPRKADGSPVGSRRRYGMRKAGEAVKAVKGAVGKAKTAVKTAKAVGGIAKDIAKDEVRRAGRSAKQAVASAPGKAKAAVERKKKEVKGGIKGFIKRQAQKVVKRMSEEVVSEADMTGAPSIKDAKPAKKTNVKYDKHMKQLVPSVKEELEATGLFSEKEIEAIMEKVNPNPNYSETHDDQSTDDEKKSRFGPPSRSHQRVDPKTGKHHTHHMTGQRAIDDYDAKRKKEKEARSIKGRLKSAAKKLLRREEVEVEEGYKEIDAKKHGRMYDRYKKLSKAAMQDARDSGEASGTNRMKMGKMSTVIDKSSENLRKKQTKDQLTGRG